MWRKSLLRGLSSYCISVTVTLLVSMLLTAYGLKSICVPSFILRAGGDLTAALLQPLLIGLIGFAFGAGSVLFEIERWSLLKQGVAHLAITASVWIAVHLVCFYPLTPPAVIIFALSAFVSYAITWGAQYFVLHDTVRRINERIRKKNEVNPS